MPKKSTQIKGFAHNFNEAEEALNVDFILLLTRIRWVNSVKRTSLTEVILVRLVAFEFWVSGANETISTLITDLVQPLNDDYLPHLHFLVSLNHRYESDMHGISTHFYLLVRIPNSSWINILLRSLWRQVLIKGVSSVKFNLIFSGGIMFWVWWEFKCRASSIFFFFFF